LGGKEQLAAGEARIYLPKNKFPMNNTLELCRGVHTANLVFLEPFLKHSSFWETIDFLSEEIKSIEDKNLKGMAELAAHFADGGTLPRLERKIFEALCQFVEKFKFLLPALGLQAYKSGMGEVVRRKGITTASFEDLKQFYLDSYEVGGELAPLVVAFNNIKHRGDFKVMRAKRTDISTIADYEGKPKGDRIQFIDGQETFDRLLASRLNSKLRNAIGHNSYEYDGATQVIYYYASGTLARGDKKAMYFVEFAHYCLDLFVALMESGELVYELTKIDRLLKGDKPVSPRVFKKSRKKR
jgi:hypothetical protein